MSFSPQSPIPIITTTKLQSHYNYLHTWHCEGRLYVYQSQYDEIRVQYGSLRDLSKAANSLQETSRYATIDTIQEETQKQQEQIEKQQEQIANLQETVKIIFDERR